MIENTQDSTIYDISSSSDSSSDLDNSVQIDDPLHYEDDDDRIGWWSSTETTINLWVNRYFEYLTYERRNGRLDGTGFVFDGDLLVKFLDYTIRRMRPRGNNGISNLSIRTGIAVLTQQAKLGINYRYTSEDKKKVRDWGTEMLDLGLMYRSW